MVLSQTLRVIGVVCSAWFALLIAVPAVLAAFFLWRYVGLGYVEASITFIGSVTLLALAIVSACTNAMVSRQHPAGIAFRKRLGAARAFFARYPRSPDHNVRQRAAAVFADTARQAWGPVVPVATGLDSALYRTVVREWVVPALEGWSPRVNSCELPITTRKADRRRTHIAIAGPAHPSPRPDPATSASAC